MSKLQTIYPEVLIISNKHDYSTDNVTYSLRKYNSSYLRLNRDQFEEMKLNLDPLTPKLYGETSEYKFIIDETKLKSIYFRAPTFLRDNYQPELRPVEQLARSQWAAFVRAISVFENVKWFNKPKNTYQAEIKPFQLKKAAEIGFEIPETIITNDSDINSKKFDYNNIILKSLDTVLLKLDNKEGFVYTNTVSRDDINNADLSKAPVILQQPLIPKVDIRVTVIEDKVFAVSIKKDGSGIDKDWRIEKYNVQYESIKLSSDLERKCVKLLKKLGLNFGAIDLAYYNNKFYFIEINPTGEWSWLLSHVDYPIDKTIAEVLIK